MPLSELLGVLDSAEKKKRELSAVVCAKPSRGRLGAIGCAPQGGGRGCSAWTDLELDILYAV